jgi:adenylate cyclase
MISAALAEVSLRKNFLLGYPLLASLVLAACVWLLLAGIVRSGALNSAELDGYDLLLFRRGEEPPPSNLVIVDFDDASVGAFACYPIPRPSVDAILEKIESGQPKYVGLDVWLTDRHCGEPDNGRLPRDVARSHNVILTDSFPAQDRVPAGLPPELRDHALQVAFGDVPVDSDGKIRRMFLGRQSQKPAEASFAAAIASFYTGESLRNCGPHVLCLGKNHVPLGGPRGDTFLIGFWGATPANEISAAHLLQPGFDPSIFRGKIVLVGQSNSQSGDLYATPEFRFRAPESGRAMMSGVEIQAAAIETLMNGPTVRVLDRAPQWALNFALIWLVVALMITVRPTYSVPAVLVGVFGGYLLAQSLFSNHQLWVHFVAMEAGIILAIPAGVGYRFLDERRLKSLAEAEQREVMDLFRRYVSPDVAAEIWSRRSEIVLAGQQKTATVLFSDIRNFTALTAGKPSAEVLAWLNNYLTAMSEVVGANRGFLNKFIGDGIMVVFGVPLSDTVEQDACRAVNTALQMIQRVDQLNKTRRPGTPDLRIGIGLHTGVLTAGNVGAPDRLEYSVIGETVNLASRLESLTKVFKTDIVMSPATQQLVASHFVTAPLGETEARGFAGKILVHGVASRRPTAKHLHPVQPEFVIR